MEKRQWTKKRREKNKGRMHACAQSLQPCSTLCDPMTVMLQSKGWSVQGILQVRTLEAGCHALLQGISPNTETEAASPTSLADSLPLRHWGSPKGYMHPRKKKR